MAGYSNTPLPKKLGIVGDAVFVVFDGPDDFEETLGDYGDAVWQKSLLAPLDVVVGFFTSRAKLNAVWPRLTKAAAPDGGAQKAREKGIQVHEGILLDASYPPGSFDLITLWDVAEHLPEHCRIVAELFGEPAGRPPGFEYCKLHCPAALPPHCRSAKTK